MRRQNAFALIIPIISIMLLAVVVFRVLPPNLFWKYPAAARQYLDGDLPRERLVDFSPFYLFLHITARKYVDHPDRVLLWLQILVTSIAAGFLYSIIHRCYGFSIALIGALVFVTNISIIIYTGTFEPEPFMLCFILGYILFALKRNGHASLFAGLFLSLSLITRSNFFPLVFITPAVYWMRERNYKKTIRSSLLFMLPVVLITVLLVTRNFRITGTFVPFAMNPGSVIYEGNNPLSAGESAIYPPLVYDTRGDFSGGSDYRHVIYRIFAKRISERPMSIPEVNRYWVDKSINFIVDHPGRAASSLAEKITFFFNGFRRHDIWYLYVKDRHLQDLIPSLPFALVSAMAILGMLLSAGAWKEKLILYAVFFTQFGIMMLTYVSERQRIAIVPIMIIFAAGLLQEIVAKKKQIRLIAAVIVLAFLFNMPNDLIEDEIHTQEGNRRSDLMLRKAIEYRSEGRYSMAGLANVQALASAPWRYEDIRLARLAFAPKPFLQQVLETKILSDDPSPSARFDLAVLFIADNRIDEAEPILADLIARGYRFNRRYSQSSLPAYYRALIFEKRKDALKTVFFLNQALRENPGDPWVLSRLAVYTGDAVYRERLVRYFDNIDAAFFLGRACLETGRYAAAVKNFSYVMSRLPEYRKGTIYYSLALAAAGEYEQGAETYLTAIEKRGDYLFREKEIIRMFMDWVKKNPQDKKAAASLAKVLIDFGKTGTPVPGTDRGRTP